MTARAESLKDHIHDHIKVGLLTLLVLLAIVLAGWCATSETHAWSSYELTHHCQAVGVHNQDGNNPEQVIYQCDGDEFRIK